MGIVRRVSCRILAIAERERWIGSRVHRIATGETMGC